jgi:hypothetical protein
MGGSWVGGAKVGAGEWEVEGGGKEFTETYSPNSVQYLFLLGFVTL